MCQCPYSGLSHFYVEPEEPPVEPEKLYQCPYSGLSHFYESEQPEETEQPEVCQCPYSSLSHFYTRTINTTVSRKNVSMPLLGLIPFLHCYHFRSGQRVVVSMPLLGLIPFLPFKSVF